VHPYDPCIFCGQNNKPSTEDVLAKWIKKALGPVEIEIRPFARYGKANLFKHVAKPKGRSLGVFSKLPCRPCNTRWMSALENTVRPILTPLFFGQKVKLTAEECRLIARWFLKIVMILDFQGDGAVYFTDDERRMVCSSTDLPHRTHIWVARCVNTSSAYRYVSINHPLKFPSTPVLQSDGYSATLSIQQLALQAFSFRKPQDYTGAVRFKLPGTWGPATVRLWPTVGPIVWPPQIALDNGGFELFSERWGIEK
jgi:hypothetical protein